MEIKPSKNRVLYIFCICFVFIFIGSTVVFTTSNNLQPVFSQRYIPPPSTTSTNQNDQIVNNNNNNNPSTVNTIGSSSSGSGQSQLNQGQQPPTFGITPSQTASCSQEVNQARAASKSLANDDCKSPIQFGNAQDKLNSQQQQQPNSNCNTKFMIGCGSFSPNNTTTSTTTPTNNQLTTATQNTVLNTVNKQTCPPLPIDANGRCPGIDMRGGGLGLPPVPPPPPAQVPNEPPKKRECSNFAPFQFDQVYFDVHLNKCTLAIIPQSNGQCVTSYEKNVDGTICEPENFHCPAGTDVQGYNDRRQIADCVSNDHPLSPAGDSGISCVPGWHLLPGGSLCVRD